MHFPTTLSILRKYAQKALCAKTPLSRGVTGNTFTDTEKNDNSKKKKKKKIKRRFQLDLRYWQPSKKKCYKIIRAVPVFSVHSLTWMECTFSWFGFALRVVLQDTSFTKHLGGNG